MLFNLCKSGPEVPWCVHSQPLDPSLVYGPGTCTCSFDFNISQNAQTYQITMEIKMRLKVQFVQKSHFPDNFGHSDRWQIRNYAISISKQPCTLFSWFYTTSEMNNAVKETRMKLHWQETSFYIQYPHEGLARWNSFQSMLECHVKPEPISHHGQS